MAQAYGAEGIVAAARHDPTAVVLEGIHAVKHAVRFGAQITATYSPDPKGVAALIAKLAPDLAVHPAFGTELQTVDDPTWNAITNGHALPSPLIGIAHRPQWTIGDIATRPGRVVALENPRHHGNIGAAIRVAAAADAAGVVAIGGADPWHTLSVRGAAGLQFALPVIACGPLDADGANVLRALDRPCFGLDPGPQAAAFASLPHDATVIFGTERSGLSSLARTVCDGTVAIPMREGVSSLNLATAVAVVLYADLANGRA